MEHDIEKVTMNEEETSLPPHKDAADGEPASGAETQAQELKDLRAIAAEYKDQLLRARAELDNQRKRAARENEDARKYALQSFVRELLPVKDSLEQGLETVTADAGEEAKALRQGIELTLRLWSGVLASSGVEEIDPLGEAFNPDLHEISFKISTKIVTQNSSENEKNWYLGHTHFRKCSNLLGHILAKIICLQDDPIVFLYFVQHFGNR